MREPSTISSSVQDAPVRLPKGAPKSLLFKKQMALLGLLLVARGLSGYAASGEPSKPNKIITLSLPSTFEGWKGKDVKVDPFVFEELHPDAVLQKHFVLPQGNTPKSKLPEIEVLVMYSHDTFGFHPPEVCLKMQGWEIANQEQHDVKGVGQTLSLSVVTAQQKNQRRRLAYSFSNLGGTATGRSEAFANMILARAMRKSAGTLELQFAYDSRSLLPNGDFIPQFKAFMLKTDTSIRSQLAKANAAAPSP